MVGAGFITVLISSTDMIMDNFYVKNFTFTTTDPFTKVTYSRTYVNSSLTATNWNVQDVYELTNEANYTSTGMIIASQSNFNTISNITANNVQLRSKIF